MPIHNQTQLSRAQREQFVTDHSNVYDNWYALNKRFRHIFDSPNTVYGQHLFDDLLRHEVPGKRVLEIGCGAGAFAERLSFLGASYVFATDISEKHISQAKQRELVGIREYALADVSVPIDGVFDVIVGKAVLHHVDYQEVLQRLSRDNLSAHGLMLFYEPLGVNWVIRIFHLLTKHAHTPDERPFERRDLRWMQKNFPGLTMIPINYLSLPLGAISSFLFKSADNALLRGADRIDRFFARHARFMHTRFRYAIFAIRKQ